VEDAWRTQVAPALADIREALAEHGLLSEAASIALGDPRRLLVEAGGVLAVAHGEVLSLSALLTTGLAAGLPLTDIAGPGTIAGLAPPLTCDNPVGEGGLEPPRPYGHWHLKPARLPIPPLARATRQER
jgi:hypothetical protein